MRTPSTFRAALLGLLAGIFAASFSAAETKDVAPQNPAAEKDSPALLLANVWNPSMDPAGWWISEKYDGLRGYWDGRKLWSRKGSAMRGSGGGMNKWQHSCVAHGWPLQSPP